MKLNRKLVLVLSLVLSLALATGGTLAYLTDRDSAANVFTIGNVDIELNEDFIQDSTLLPGVDVEKKPTITNTGKNDAWVWATIAIPATLDDSTAAYNNVLHFNYEKESVEDGLWNWQDEQGAWRVTEGVEIDENGETDILYNVYTVLYETPLKPGETTEYPVMTKVYLDTHVDITPEGDMYWVDAGVATDLKWNINEQGGPIMYVSAYAIQTNNFDNVVAAYNAYNAQWGENGTEYGTATKVEVGTDEALKDALAADQKDIVVSLTDDVTYDVAAWAQNGLGGESTETVTILGNGHTITFNQTNSDWNNIVTNNGATLIISNAKLTNSGHNDGPWNRHDLNFGCDVKLVDVTTDKALAFKAGATLKNVTISDANTSDTYAIWIQPNGQTVTLENCTIDMLDCTDGRGIKIDEQYVSAPEKVTLKVSDTTFKTEEKSAILVKSKAGADVVLSNVNIDAVAADSTNPVWVDEASAAYADLVVVTGGSKIVEP